MKPLISVFLILGSLACSADEGKRMAELRELRNANIFVEVKITDKDLVKLLEEIWEMVGGQERFLGMLTAVLPREEKGEGVRIDRDTISVHGEKAFVAVTTRLLTEIMLNPSLEPDDFKSLLAGAGAPPELMKELNELRVRLGLTGDAAD